MNHQRLIDQIERDYRHDNDIGTPRVTYTDITLLELVKDLYEQIETLKAQLAERPTWEQLAEKEALIAQQDY